MSYFCKQNVHFLKADLTWFQWFKHSLSSMYCHYLLRKAPHGAKYFTNRSKSGGGCLIVHQGWLPGNPRQQMSFQTSADLEPLSNYSRRAEGEGPGKCDWANKGWHHWLHLGNMLQMVHWLYRKHRQLFTTEFCVKKFFLFLFFVLLRLDQNFQCSKHTEGQCTWNWNNSVSAHKMIMKK